MSYNLGPQRNNYYFEKKKHIFNEKHKTSVYLLISVKNYKSIEILQHYKNSKNIIK